VEAFATPDDLSRMLRREFALGEETAWIQELLENASTYLRDEVIGFQIYPKTTTTYTDWPPSDGWVTLPQSPLVSVDAVTRNGRAVPFQRRDNRIYVDNDEQVEITFTYGLEKAPESLRRWACVLTSQVLTTLELKLGLSAGGLSSIQIDDFRAAWADAGEQAGMNMHDRNQAALRRQFGATNNHVVDTYS
jgi:hypothetical protein